MSRLTRIALTSALYCNSIAFEEKVVANKPRMRRILHPVEVVVGSLLSLPPEPSSEVLMTVLACDGLTLDPRMHGLPNPLAYGFRLEQPEDEPTRTSWMESLARRLRSPLPLGGKVAEPVKRERRVRRLPLSFMPA